MKTGMQISGTEEHLKVNLPFWVDGLSKHDEDTYWRKCGPLGAGKLEISVQKIEIESTQNA